MHEPLPNSNAVLSFLNLLFYGTLASYKTQTKNHKTNTYEIKYFFYYYLPKIILSVL